MNDLYSKYGVVGYANGGPVAGTPEYTKMVSDWFKQYPDATAADVSSAIKTYGLNPDDVVNAMRSSGMSGASIYSAFHPDVGVPETPQGGLAGLSSNINQFVDQARARADLTPAQIREEAYRAMINEGYSMDDVRRATGKTVDELFPDMLKRPVQPVQPPAYSQPDYSAPQPGPIYDVTPAGLYDPVAPFTDPNTRQTIYPNYLPTAFGPQPTYFPTSWWTGSPSASLAYGMTAPLTAPDFNAQMEEYRKKYAPVYTLPAAPPPAQAPAPAPAPGTPGSGPKNPPTEYPGYGNIWVWEWDGFDRPSQGRWVTRPDPNLQAATGGAVSELWDKYHG